MQSSQTNAHWLMLITSLLVASSFPIGAMITNSLPPAILMLIRFALAATLFAPYVFIKNGMALPPVKQLFWYALLSLPLVIFFWCMFESLRYTSALNTGALYTLVPAITAVYALFINQEKTSQSRAAGLLLGTVGALWIVFRGDFYKLITLDLGYGDFVFIIGCCFLGLYNPLVKKIHQGEPQEVMTFWALLFGAGWLLALAWPSLFAVQWDGITNKIYFGVVYLAVFPTLITFFLLQKSIMLIGATKVAAYSFLTPVLVILLSVIFGLAQFEIATVPGVLIVLVSMWQIQK